MKKNKIIRKNFRFTEQVAGMLSVAAKSLKCTESDVVSTCIFDTLSDRSKFIICPKCDKYLAYKSTLPIISQVVEVDCKCGGKLWWDADEDKILKAV